MIASRFCISQHDRGFTLIELLVVIAIIGVLSGVVLASLSSARVKSRDARRMADLRTIQTAVERYMIDNGHYPNAGGNWTSFDAPNFVNNPIASPDAPNLAAALAPYLPTAPKDPRPGVGNSGYLYKGAGANYCILIFNTPENMNDFPRHLAPPSRCSVWDSGGQCTSPQVWNAIYVGAGTYASDCP